MNEHEDPFEADLDGFPIVHDIEALSTRDPFEVLLSRFSEEVRHGRCPSIEEYARRHPQFAERIREFFPLVENLERWKADKEVECFRRNLPQHFPVRRLGPYDIIRELGRGGMGIVFEAVHERTKRRVAVKLLPWRSAQFARWRQRLHREAATIARLRHQNIVPVYAFGQSDGYSYYVMQLVEGVSLEAVVRRLRQSPEPVDIASLRPGLPRETRGTLVLSRDSWQTIAEMMLQVALALDHAHRRGVIHNDIKPANLLVDESGRVVVSDFGMGLEADDVGGGEERPTGTLRYMPPERLLGGGDQRGDVYALGVTLYELLTLRPAFDADEHGQLMDRILRCDPPRPRQLVPAIPKPLEWIVRQAMARDPSDRYPTATALASDLRRFTRDEPVEARRPSAAMRLREWWQNRRPASAARPI